MTKTKIQPLTKAEKVSLKKVMDKLESEAYFPIKKLNGSYVESKIFDFDEDFVDIELQFGIQDGSENSQYTETYKWNRETKTLEEA